MKVSKIFLRIAFCLLIVSMMVGGWQSNAAAKAPAPKNIIIMIGDGMDINHSLAGSYFAYGKAGGQVYSHFPVSFSMTTFSVDGEGYNPSLAWKSWSYLMTGYTDSAAAATALATGVKTHNDTVGVDVDGNPVENIMEAATKVGKATGVISSVPFSHATPAGFVAHNVDRNDYYGLAQEMILQSKVDLIMGAGNPLYDDNGELLPEPVYDYVDEATWDALVNGEVITDADSDGDLETTQLIQTRADFQALMSGPTPERVVGVPEVASTLQLYRAGDETAAPFTVPLNPNVPTVSEMALGALNVLDNDPDGFVIMMEAGGAIDWASHDGNPTRFIEEQVAFDQSVQTVVDWVEKNSNWGETMLIIAADHETGYLWGPGSDPTWVPIVNNGAGVMPGIQFNYDDHTNSLVRMYAKGDDARWFKNVVVGTDPVRGKYIDNTSIANVIFQLIGK